MRRLLSVVFLAMILAIGASASTISFTGTFSASKSSGDTFSTFTFGGGDVDLPLSLNGTPYSVSPTSFTWGGGTSFAPTGATFAIGTSNSSGSGILSGDLGYVSITGSGGSFDIKITLTNMTYDCQAGCTSNTHLASFGSLGKGLLTFQFVSGTPQNLSDFYTAGIAFDRTGDNGTTISGSITTVPEPASMALLGTGMLAGGRFIRRKLKK